MRPIAFLILLAALCFHGNRTLARDVVLTGGNNILPVMYQSEQGPTGFAIEIARVALERAGLTVKVKLFPWARAVAIAKHGDAFITGFSYTDSRAHDFTYSELLVNEAMVLVTLADIEIRYDRAEDLAGRRIGFMNGATFGEEFENLRRFIHPDPDTEMSRRLQKLMMGRLDAGIFAQSMIPYFPDLFGIRPERLAVLPKQVGQSAMYLAVGRNSPDAALMDRINDAIAAMHADGTVDRLYRKKYHYP